jgi:hypothetical protein
VAFDRAGAPLQGAAGGDGVLVAAQAGDEGPQFGLVVGHHVFHPCFQAVAAAFGHESGEGLHVGVEGG